MKVVNDWLLLIVILLNDPLRMACFMNLTVMILRNRLDKVSAKMSLMCRLYLCVLDPLC